MKLWHIKRETLENAHTRALLSIRWDDNDWEIAVVCPVPFSRLDAYLWLVHMRFVSRVRWMVKAGCASPNPCL